MIVFALFMLEMLVLGIGMFILIIYFSVRKWYIVNHLDDLSLSHSWRMWYYYSNEYRNRKKYMRLMKAKEFRFGGYL